VRTALAGSLLLAVACGYHDTPLASVAAGGSAGSGGSSSAAAGPSCLQTYPLAPAGLTSRYKEVASGQTWVLAERDCESEGGHLIVIDDEAENTWMASVAAKALTDNVSSHQLSWIGLSDQVVEGTFRWVTGVSSSVELWAEMEPNSLYDNEDCVEIRASGRWNDDHCDALLSYVCECDGASAAGQWCDTDAVETCGDCSTACMPELDCFDQRCEPL
jgi:hypothetical protein